MSTSSAHKKSISQNGSLRVFGPVQSRRLGASLGIDCVPFKTCNYDCIYCELGKTPETSNIVETGVAVSEILDEVAAALDQASRPDYLTVAGAGEPTLYGALEELIAGLKALTDIPVALLTNGALFYRKDVRQAASRADLVGPSLDAGNARTFAAVNRPHPEIPFHKIAEGLCLFRKEFTGTLWLEILLVDGINTSAAELADIKVHADRIAPDRIHLNTVDRHPAESFARSVHPDRMREIAALFGARARIV